MTYNVLTYLLTYSPKQLTYSLGESNPSDLQQLSRFGSREQSRHLLRPGEAPRCRSRLRTPRLSASDPERDVCCLDCSMGLFCSLGLSFSQTHGFEGGLAKGEVPFD